MLNKVLNFGHSPDTDDAYMFYGLGTGRVGIPGYRIQHRIAEIEELNRRALQSEYEVTAVSAHCYAYIADKYAVLASGASVARGYGPKVVTLQPMQLNDLEGKSVAVPGELTTAYLLARLFMPPFRPIFLPFREVDHAVKDGRATAAILIHEGQIQVRERGYEVVLDLGEAFYDATRLPLPLGLDVVRRDIGDSLACHVAVALRRSIELAHSEHEKALDYALKYGSGLSRNDVSRFVRMYVNDDTLDLPADAEEGLRELYRRSYEAKIIPRMVSVDLVR